MLKRSVASFISIRRLKGAVFLIGLLLLVLGGCAAKPVQQTDLPLPEGKWQDRVLLPDSLRATLLKGHLEMLQSEDRASIPMRVYGPGGNRTPFVLLHGLQSHSGWFAQSAAYIAGLGHPVYAMDRRGSGLSTAPRGDMKDFMDMSKDIQAVAAEINRRHGDSRFYLLGHCFGAIPAAVFACQYPQRLKGLIFSTPAIYTKTSIPFSQSLKIFLTPSGRRDYPIASPLDPAWFSELEEFEAFIRSDDLALQAATGDFYFQVYRARKYIQRNIQRLTMPVFMAVAGEDPICDNPRNIEFFERLPAEDKLLATYPDARHILEFSTERERFFKDIACWLNREEN